MDNYNLSDFKNNKLSIDIIDKWLNSIDDNPKFKKRICFLTGLIGTCKKKFIELLLNKHNYSIKYFESYSLRVSKERHILYQTLCYKNILQLVNKKVIKKAIIINNYEDLGFSKKEIFKNINDIIINNKSIGIPIILIGTSIIKNKKLKKISVYTRLLPFKLKNPNEIIKSPLGSLYNIINYDSNLTIDNIIDEIKKEKNIPFGLNNSYIDYCQWILKKKKINFKKTRYLNLCVKISNLYSTFGYIYEYNKYHNYWNLYNDINFLVCWGYRTILKSEIEKKICNGKDHFYYKYNNKWWESYLNNISDTDNIYDSPILIKQMRSSLNYGIQSRQSFKMIENNIFDSKCWKPKNIEYNLEILKLLK